MSLIPDPIASWVPFLAAGVGHASNPPSKQVAVRLAEIALVIAFLTWQMQEIKGDVKELAKDVSELNTKVAVATRGEAARDQAMDQVQDRLKNITGRIRDLERATPRQASQQ